MIAFVKGKIAEIAEDNVVVDVGGIGYNVKISAGTVSLLPGMGQEIKLYTYTHIREDVFQLYGFLTGDDREVFKKLITVNGIGPKGGLAVLSVMSADDLRFAILTGDAKAISKAPGIGVKTAERIILDLRDKVSPEDILTAKGGMGSGSPAQTGFESDSAKEAAEALVALGYGAAEALKAVKKVEQGKDMDAEAVLKAALKNIG